jgi:hypothetical protein
MSAAIEAVVPGARVKFDAPAGTAIALSNHDSVADLSRAKHYLGYHRGHRGRRRRKPQAKQA